MDNFEKMINDWGSLTIKQSIERLIEFCSHITSWDSDLRKKALLKMEELGASTNQWWQLYECVPWHLELLDNKLSPMVKAKIS
jgi:hypothetical protein